LLNALAGRDVAIVSAHAGTTRDAIEVALDLGGCPLVLIDTAGLRETDDPVEREGMVRARARAASADLVLWLSQQGTSHEAASLPATGGELWRVATKIDLSGEPPCGADYAISARTGAGVDGLLAGLRAFAGQHTAGWETALITRLRHRMALEEARDALARVLASERADLELVAEDLRAANAALAGLIGAVQVEEVLGSIFARFCIGK
jgi:tRNA modification GTPase